VYCSVNRWMRSQYIAHSQSVIYMTLSLSHHNLCCSVDCCLERVCNRRVSRSIARSNHGLSHRPSVTHDDDMITKKARMVRESINQSSERRAISQFVESREPLCMCLSIIRVVESSPIYLVCVWEALNVSPV
jgi:hypothetical protein